MFSFLLGVCLTKFLLFHFLGPRTFLDELLARMELFLVFANLLQRFTFKREDPNVKHSLQPRLNQITYSPLPYKIKVKQR